MSIFVNTTEILKRLRKPMFVLKYSAALSNTCINTNMLCWEICS